MRKFIRQFGEMTRSDIQEAGGKAANLGELTRNHFNVPHGFCVTSDALAYHLDQNNLRSEIDSMIAGFNYEDFESIEGKTAAIRGLIIDAEIPEDLYGELSEAIEELNEPKPSFVAVRSSVAVKNSPISSFPGMMDTYHYLKGRGEIIKHIKMCWASLWTSRATLNRYHKKIDHSLGMIAPIVQNMVHSEVAGVLFTANPINRSRDELVIESNWGLGESVVSGKSMNDFFLLQKSPLMLKDKKILKKTIMISFDEQKGFGGKETAVGPERMDVPTLTEEQALEVAEIGIKIEKLFGSPQDIEWAYDHGELFILQSRNIRTLMKPNRH